MKRHAVNHFYEKLLKIKDTINTNEARNIAIERTKYMEGFLEEFYKEWDGKKQMDVLVIGDTAKDINIFKGRTQKEDMLQCYYEVKAVNA